MLPERLLLLLTAYVDGEMNPRQRKILLRLLSRSREARAMLRQLRADAARLRALPRHQLSVDFTQRVMQNLRDGNQPAAWHHPKSGSDFTLPLWFGATVAAAVFMATGVGSYFYFASPSRSHSSEQALARLGPSSEPKKRNAPLERKPSIAPLATAPPPPKPTYPPKKSNQRSPQPIPSGVAASQIQRPESARQRVLPDKMPATTRKPQAPIPNADIKQSQVKKRNAIRPQTAKADQESSFDLHKLKGNTLVERLKKEPVFRLEMPCRETYQAFHRLEAACKSQGLGIVIEAEAQRLLKASESRANYVLYIEDITPEELSKLLLRIASLDKKTATKPNYQFSKIAINPASQKDRQELVHLLGTDPRAPQKDAARTPGKPQHLALLLAYNSARPSADSAEVKHFLNHRKKPRPNTLEIILVLSSKQS